MPLHYLDPNDEPRECITCVGRGCHPFDAQQPCRRCAGTGRLGDPEARPIIEVWFSGLANPSWIEAIGGDGARWYWAHIDDADPSNEHGPYPTEPLALEAARRALRDGGK